MSLRPKLAAGVVLSLFSVALLAQPSTSGQTGLITLPNARMAPDGTWTLGFSYADPYVSLYSNLTALPFLELSLSGFRIMHTPGFANNDAYGDYKDKRADAKLRLLAESEWMPEVALGGQDIIGTRLFGAEYIVASKRIGERIDLTLGYGRKTLTSLGATNAGSSVKRNRLGGVFGGVRVHLNDSWALVAEKDPVDYAQDPKAVDTRVVERRTGTSVGVEYRWEALGIQASRQGNEWGVNTFIQIPLNKREFLPKFNEPEPYTRLAARPNLAEWRADRGPERALRRALDAEEFGGVVVTLGEDGVLALQVGHPQISQMARAVGRAARIALLTSPVETREIRITYMQGSLPVATYAFFDLDMLRRYFNGQVMRRQLAETVAIRFADKSPAPAENGSALAGFDEERERPLVTSSVGDDESGHVLAFRRKDADLGEFGLVPFKIGSMVNDPSGFYQFQIFSELSWSKRLGANLFLDTAMTFRLYDTFKDGALAANNNSPLPHVRTDVSRYIASNRLRLDRLTLSRYYHLAPRWYGRLSAGLYEMMFSGVGGQVLYFPESGPWAADVAVDAVKQRDYAGWLKHQSYSTVTTIGSLHYRFQNGVKISTRAGRFLARDSGVRFELSRRFVSGMELGGWMTLTNNEDLNASGSAGKPYKDKGVFLNIPFEIMLTKDSRARGSIALAEWNRDVGKMVAAPGDLYGMLEKPLIDREDRDGLVRFGDVDDDYDLPSMGTGRGVFDRPLLKLAYNDASNFGDWITSLPTWGKIGLGAGAVVASTVLDNRGLKIADQLQGKRWVRYAQNIGNLLPVAAGGAAAALALDGRDPRLADAGFAAVQAGVGSVLAVEGLKYMIHRSRPEEGKGAKDFNARSRLDSSMPSGHTALAWAVATPFAKQYDAPWLYGVAALTNVARVSSRKHWVSDTVAGAVVGYGLGSLFWEWRAREAVNGPAIAVSLDGVAARWQFH
jgi:membrane-associated phospholipid phosphatase